MMGLTSRQAQLLAFIDQYIRDHQGVAPSFCEMEDGIDLHSRSEIHRLLKQLESRGAIRRFFNRARAIEVLVQLDHPPQQVSLEAMATADLTALSARIDAILRSRACGVAA